MFRGKNEYETIRLIAESQIRPPSQVRAGFPKRLEAIIMRALAHHPMHRFQSAEEMQLALEEWLIEQRVPLSPVHLSRYMGHLFPEFVDQQGAPSLPEETIPSQVPASLQGHAPGSRPIFANTPTALTHLSEEYDAAGQTAESTLSEATDPTRAIALAEFQEQLEQDQFDHRQGSYHEWATPMPRERQFTPARAHDAEVKRVATERLPKHTGTGALNVDTTPALHTPDALRASMGAAPVPGFSLPKPPGFDAPVAPPRPGCAPAAP